MSYEDAITRQFDAYDDEIEALEAVLVDARFELVRLHADNAGMARPDLSRLAEILGVTL